MPLLTYIATPSWLMSIRRRLLALIPVRFLRHVLYLLMIRKPGNFREPATFNEKVNWRILHDRRRTIADACDKLRMKETARRLVPDEGRLRIPRTIWAGTDPDRAPVDAGEPWIMKPNHSSGEVLQYTYAPGA